MNNQFDSPRERSPSLTFWRQPAALSRGKLTKSMAQSVTRRGALIEMSVVGLALLSIVSLGVADEPTLKTELLAGWGTATDPAGDCKFEKADGKLTITVPGSEKAHNLSPEKTNTTAPRVVQPVAGDFVIQVRVDGEFQPGTESTQPGRTPYTGAGLVVFADTNNLVRLERATLYAGGKPRPYTNFEIRVDGKLERIGNTGDLPTEQDKPTWLRLERKGSQILGAMSQDGEHWIYGEPKELRAEVWRQNNIVAGVAAISNSRNTFAPTYSAFSVRQGANHVKDTTESR